jgi:hypothetical protein
MDLTNLIKRKIKELNRKIIKTPVNGELLKKYYNRKNFKPMVVVRNLRDSNFLAGDSL